jgi:outer membrane protein with beta-barrel domain
MNRALAVFVCVLSTMFVSPAAAQSEDGQFQIGGQFVAARSSQFDSKDFGVGTLVAWRPTTLFGVEADLSLYPGDFDDKASAFSGRRVEGLFGVTAGPRIGHLRPFAKLRPGFLTFGEASEPIPCILIFPPPLHCTLGGGKTLFALDLGGGIEFYPTAGTFVRADAGDRAVRYPAPTLDSNGRAREDSFYSHDFRFTIGGGVRF